MQRAHALTHEGATYPYTHEGRATCPTNGTFWKIEHLNWLFHDIFTANLKKTNQMFDFPKIIYFITVGLE